MSTANFHSMADFPLIVAENPTIKICPKCFSGGNGDVCEICGENIADVQEEYDDILGAEICRDMQKWADRMNAAQKFYDVSVQSGHYTGVQFYVEDKYWNIADMDNEESQEEFGMCRSAMLRKYKVAGNTVRRMLKQAKDEMGLMELAVAARFSNGETWYSKVA